MTSRFAFSRAFLQAGIGPVPITLGSTPADANAFIVQRGFKPRDSAFSFDIRTNAAAPSLIPEALAAVTVPPLVNAGCSADIFSMLDPNLGYSSVSNTIGSFFF